MENNYTLGKFFDNKKEYGVRKAFKIDASETINDLNLKYIHRRGLDFSENLVKRRKEKPNIHPEIHTIQDLELITAYAKGIIHGLFETFFNKKQNKLESQINGEQE